MSEHYNQGYSYGEIEILLKTIQDCIRENRYIIAKNENRQENIDFINEYNLTSTKQKTILLNIVAEDFCHSLQNTKPGFEHEILYVFCLQTKLFNIDDIEENVDIYIKFNLVENMDNKRVIVISFHKRNRPIDYPFK